MEGCESCKYWDIKAHKCAVTARGCIHFEPKPKGPFVYGSDHKGNYVCHLPSQTTVGYWWKEDNAREACEAINEEWLRRE